MEPSQSSNTKVILAAVIILVVLGVGYVWFGNRVPGGVGQESSGNGDQETMVVVENTPMVNGILDVPKGFPQDIPVETSGILESSTTHYPEQNAQQWSVSYQSSKTVAQKYTEYKTYLTQAGYNLTEGDINSPVRTIFATKGGTNLSVAISSAEGGALVQLSYLLTSL